MSHGAIRSISLGTSALVATGLIATGSALPAAATTTATPKACTAAACSVVSRADVDGDGRTDTVSLTRLDHGKAYSLRVVTAKHQVATTRVATPWLFGTAPFYGSARLDGVRGAELVIRVGSGAHTQYFNVFTWRSGTLVPEKDPSGSREWITDGALSSAMGYTLKVSGGTRQLTSIALGRDSWEKNATFSGRRVVSTWKNGRWTPTSDKNVTVPDSPALWNGSGWNVKGLQRY